VVSTAKYFAPKLLALFVQEHPEVVLRLAMNNREAVVQQLAGQRNRPRHHGYAAAYHEHRGGPLRAPPAGGHRRARPPLMARKRIPLKTLEQETFLVREPGSGTRSAMERFFAEHEVNVRIGMEISSNETIKQAVMAGMGLAFISQHTIGLEVSRPFS
jgi:LysR family transcriptional regulator, low CO2-responsive transcriptional regulator